MIVVTGAAGFIGSNLVAALNARGFKDVVAVDHLKNGHKYRNLRDLSICDYLDRAEFIARLRDGSSGLDGVEAVFHLGACSATTEWDGQYMMDNNYRYSKEMFDACSRDGVPFIYASSASVYGASARFAEEPEHEKPLNVYGYSKLLFDQFIRRRFQSGPPGCQVVGLRFFNVYGPREQHKGSMASVAFHFDRSVRKEGVVRLFDGHDGYGPGEQRRDFVHVDDVVAVMLWFFEHPAVSGVFNVGTGVSETFNEVARAVLRHHGHGRIEYIPFPPHLASAYQSFTQADLTRLRAAGCDVAFRGVAAGVADYLKWLELHGA